MDYMVLGKSGIKVSKIGLGVWQASEEWKGDDEAITEGIQRSHELGVNLVDTAEAYGKGHSEEVIGRAVKEIGRDEFVIASKVKDAHLRYDELQRACLASSSRLGVKEIDVYQVHWPDPWEQIPLRETMRALERLYMEGRIRAIGVSNFAVRDLEEARSYLSRTDIVSNQVRYNLLQRNVEEEVLPYCKREGISIMAWSPLAQGALTGKYRRDVVPSGDPRGSNRLFSPRNIGQVERLNSCLGEIARRHVCTNAQVALSWLASNPIVVPIPGARNAAQAEENACAVDIRLTREELNELDMVAREVKIDYFP